MQIGLRSAAVVVPKHATESFAAFDLAAGLANVLLRVVVNGLLGFIPLYGVVDILFIFREDRRCIHDLIAGTVVVNA